MYIIMYLDPAIWGPHYWFFLHTLAMTYPHHPNSVTKKKILRIYPKLSLVYSSGANIQGF